MRRASGNVLLYVLSLGLCVGAFFVIRFFGSPLVASGAPEPSKSAAPPFSEASGTLTHLLLALVVIIVVARVLGTFFAKLSQPRVVGEIVAGILLGPSFLGWLAPSIASRVLPVTISPYLALISQVGVVLYMFLVGLELDTQLLRHRTRTSIAISHAGIVIPFLLGATLALWLFPRYAAREISFAVFALFIGVAMSVTAFPVLARILTDRGLQKTPLGVLALTCAAIDDVTAWCLLALLVGVAHARAGNALFTLLLAVGFILFVLLVARRGAQWLVQRQIAIGRTSQEMFAVVCATLLLAALVTERIGIHSLFGAFLIGVVIPHDSELAVDIRNRMQDLVIVLFLPAFFAFTGLRTHIGMVHGFPDLLACILIIALASLGKFGGCFLAARWTGSPGREAASIGVLMNTRGLMELIVLNVGLDLGVLSPTLFTMFVIMAVTTTLATAPILHRLSDP
jgi:Kef-type K+ transport system membrane component KefB